MSLLSLSKSLRNILPRFASVPPPSSVVSTIISNTSPISSPKRLKQFAYLCNYYFQSEGETKLKLAAKLLQNHISTCKQQEIKVSESMTKLLIITKINQSIYYEASNPSKSMLILVDAIKLAEHTRFRSLQGTFLKFIAKLRECDLCIVSQKFVAGVVCAQKILREVLARLEVVKAKKVVLHLTIVAVNAFYKIGVCEDALGNRTEMLAAYSSAEALVTQYLSKNEDIMAALDGKLTENIASVKKRAQSPEGLTLRRQKPVLSLKIPNDGSRLEGQAVDRMEEKLPGRYYSNRRLKDLTKLLFENHDPIVLNSDNYFYSHISRALDLASPKLNPGRMGGQIKNYVTGLTKSKVKLKNRRKVVAFSPPAESGSDLVHKKIDRLQQEFENRLKLQEIKMKSKLKSKVYRKLLRNINVPTRIFTRGVPEQKIFFTEPAMRRMTTLMSTFLEETTVKKPDRPAKHVDEINQEIEEQLEELYKEINGVQSQRINPQAGDFHSSKLGFSALRKGDVRIKTIADSPPRPGNSRAFFQTEIKS